MARTNGEGRLKKHNCCLTCSIICFILLIVFIVALYVGGTIMFRTYVSPHIGGLELNDAIALATNVLSGKEAKSNYTEADLDSFYAGLSDAMFLSDKNETELEYELIPDETRASLAAGSVSAAEEESSGSSYDEDAAYDAFCLKTPAQRYALLPDDTKEKLSLSEFSSLAAKTDAAQAARDKVGLKTYRLSIEALMKDMNFGASDFDAGKALEKTFSSLEFNFDSLENYDISNAAAEQNEKFTTFSVNGKQVSAFINDVIAYLLTTENSPLTSFMKESLPVDIPFADYVNVASVTIMNTPLATSNGEAIYDQKDTALGVTISIRLRDIVVAALETAEIKDKLASVPSFAVDLIPKLVPKFFSAGVTIFPLANEEDGREVTVTVNNSSEKNVQRISTLVNALLSKDDGENAKTFFGELNDTVASTFKSIDDTVKINFVPSKDSEGKPLKDEKGNTYSEMKIMTWETVLSLIDKENRLSPHDVFTMLKCLYISRDTHLEIDTDTALSAFKTDMSQKYGVESEYINDMNILSTEDLTGMVEHIDLSSIDLKTDNEAMRVHLSAEALAAFMKKYVSEKAGSSSAAAAEESSSSNLLDGLNPKVCDVTIEKISETDGVSLYSFELGILVGLSDMLEEKLPSDGIGGTLSKKLLPKGDSYFCIKLYMTEYHDTETDKLMHKVGKNIDNPAEGETSLYLSKIRINDFTYDETSRVFDAINNFMQVLSDTSFEVSSITSTIENAVNDVFTSISNNDYNVALRLYSKNDETEDRGGLSMPSLYELLSNVVKPKLQPGEAFTVSDARDVLIQIYQSEVNNNKYFTDDLATTFIDEINDKYYIKKDSALTVDLLFGKDGEGNSNASALSDRIKATSIYFKPDATEEAKWDTVKKSLYGDNRTIDQLHIRLTGKEVAALVEESNLVPSDVAASFGSLEVLGAKFKTENHKTYLIFDLKLVRKTDDEGLKFGKAMPDTVKMTAKILLYAPSYTETEPRYSSTLKINDASSEKTFILLRALGGETLSEKSISDKISQSLSTTFNTLEGKIPLSYANTDGTPFTVGSDNEECILIADVYSFLIKETNMKDLDEEATAPTDLAARLRGFGKQAVGDSANEGIYTWLNNLNLFTYTNDGDDSNDDDAYVYKNMKEAYFMKAEMTLDDIYGDGTFSNKFSEIKTTSFNLKDDNNGLFYYDGDIKSLKISDKALGVIVKKKQNFTAAVSGSGTDAEIMSLKLYHEGGKLVIECGVKVSFTGDTYASLPSYFFVISKTVKDGSNFTTTLTMNNLLNTETDELFKNVTALQSKGVRTDTFDQTNIVSTINTQIASAFNNLPSSVQFGEFTQSDLTNEYHTGATYPVGCSLPEEGSGYLSFPSVYYYMIDIFYSAADKATYDPQEEDIQHMLLSLHSQTVAENIVTNPKSSTAYHAQGYKDNNFADYVIIFSDKYLANEISTRLSTEKLNGDISLNDSIQQAIILRKGLTDEKWGAWEDRFYANPATETYSDTHDYLIITVKVSLSGYVSGNADLLPSDLYLSVLVDLNDSTASKGLLYNMNHTDMGIFEFIMHKYNSQFQSVDNIASQLATIIDDKLNSIKSQTIPYVGTVDLTLNYRVADRTADEDHFSYCLSLPYSSASAKDVLDPVAQGGWNDSGIDPTDDPLDPQLPFDPLRIDGVGYVILSLGAIS